MPFLRREQVGLRLFAMLTIAFAIVGATATFLLHRRAAEDVEIQAKQELKTMVQLAALQVDPESHVLLISKEQENTDLYRNQIARLDKALTKLKDVRYIYTLRRVGKKFFFILDPTQPGDHDKNGVDDKSYLMEPYDQQPVALVRTYETGVVQVDQKAGSDKWGTFISAYAPIFDSNGKVIAVLGIDRDYKNILEEQNRLKQEALMALFLVLGLSAAIAWLVTSKIISWGEWLRQTPKGDRGRDRWRYILFEACLATLILTILVTSVATLAGGNNDLKTERTIWIRNTQISDLRNEVEKLVVQENYDPAKLKSLSRRAEELRLEKVAAQLKSVASMSARRDRKAQLDQVFDQLKNAYEERRAQRQMTIERLYGRIDSMKALLIIATLLSLGALVAMHNAMRQQKQLVEAQTANVRHEAVYQQLVEGLPVGLFTYKSGFCGFANPEWERQTDRKKGERRDQAFARALHPEDREYVQKALAESETKGEAFILHYRLEPSPGETRYVECRGVPVRDPAGHMEHMLAFNVDITRTVQALSELQEKHAELESANDLLRHTLEDLENNIEAMVLSLVKAVDAKDPYTAGHSERVMEYSLRLGRAMGLGDKDMNTLRRGTLIHDLGKIGIPDAILTKKSYLTDEEFAIVKLHPVTGDAMIKGLGFFQDCSPIVRWHHERLDGSGYPDGLSGDEISQLVRIATVADIFDAMTSTRAYRDGLPIERALEELHSEARAGALDLEIVQIFTEVIKREGAIPQEQIRQIAA